MKYRFTISILLLSLMGFCQTTLIPDDNFEAALIEFGLDDVADNQVLTANIDTVQQLSIFSHDIADLTGIQDFTALQELFCSDNNLTTIDLSGNTLLRRLFCGRNNLTSLNLSTNTLLKTVYCDRNNLTELDVSMLPELNDFNCERNNIGSLDLSNNGQIEYLNCSDNNLTELDITECLILTYLHAEINQLTALNLDNNVALNSLSCYANNLIVLNLENNTELETLFCFDNDLTTLNVEGLSELGTFFCGENKLTELDLKSNTGLYNFSCRDNLLFKLDFRNGNNALLWTDGFNSTGNEDLLCISVDDLDHANANWTNKDDHTTFDSHCTLGIETEKELMINVYPNPATINLKVEVTEKVNYQLISMDGKSVKHGVLTAGVNQLDIANCDAGMYQLVLSTDNFRAIHQTLIK